MSTDTVRAFLALEIPAGIKRVLAEGRDALREELPGARWVRPEGQHLTLKFLGDTPRDVLNALVSDLAPGLAGLGEVTVSLRGGGFFPNPRRPRVAWIGGIAEGIEPVVGSVERTASRLGLPSERRRWSLHLTQARLDRPWPEWAVERFLRWAGSVSPPPFRAAEVVLFSSTLQPGGAVYTPLERMPLE